MGAAGEAASQTGGRVSLACKHSEGQGGDHDPQWQSNQHITGEEGGDPRDLTPRAMTSRMPVQTLLAASSKPVSDESDQQSTTQGQR